MQGLLIAGTLSAAIALPHLLPVNRVAPVTAGAVWLLALALRAVAGTGAAVAVLVFLPQSAVFETIARWCLHHVAPLLGKELSLSGHSIADAVVVVPVLALATSLLWGLFGAAHGAIVLRRYLKRRSCGHGPQGSTIVDDSDVVVAVTGLGRPHLVVSEAALSTLDAEELSASLAHEQAHLRRWHRPVLLAGTLLRTLGRWLPGTAAAEHGLAFNVERDADECAVRHTRDPLALASAICKAAGGARRPPLTAALRGRDGVGLRLQYLMDGGTPRAGAGLEHSVRLLAVVMAGLTLAASAALPAWALASPVDHSSPAHAALVCCH